MDLGKHFTELVVSNDIAGIKRLIEAEPSKTSFLINQAFTYSVRENNQELFDLLLENKKLDLLFEGQEVLIFLCRNNNFNWLNKILDLNNKKVEDLIKNPKSEYECLLRYASRKGATETIRTLINRYSLDPSRFHNTAIAFAYVGNKTSTVKLLWSFQSVKDKLKIEDIDLYKELLVIDKVKDF
jgi:hypothetical protein